MSVTAYWYGKGLLAVANNDVKWTADTIKVMLASASYVPNQDTHDFRDDVTNEVSGTGWAAGGVALANKTATYDGASNEVRLDADDVSQSGVTIANARYAVLYKARGGASSADELLGYVDFGGDQSVSGATFAITWDASGALKITAS